MSTVSTPRLIALDAVHNFRDLGGYPTTDGRATRWRTLFRADGLYRLTADDLEVVRALDIRTVLDLRTFAELDERGTYPVDDHPVAFHHLPLLDVTWDPASAPDPAHAPTGFLASMYLDMLERGRSQLAEAFALLAASGALPAVFHCAAGKDRTGLLAALMLASLGVPDDHVVADYALTGDAMVRLRTWMEQHNPEWLASMDAQPAAFLAADPEAMAGVLAHLRAEHGSVRAYVEHLGVPPATLAALEDALLEG